MEIHGLEYMASFAVERDARGQSEVLGLLMETYSDTHRLRSGAPAAPTGAVERLSPWGNRRVN
jgi:hypothetical protein